MTIGVDELRPWVEDAIRALEMGRGARVLQLTAHDASHARAIRTVTGSSGTLLILEPSPAMADSSRRIEGVDVVVLRPDGEEEFGRFDAVYACPDWNPGWPLELWAKIFRTSLRPGGRFVLDLPADNACDAIDAAWPQDVPSPLASKVHRWRGPTPKEAEDAMRAAGLRAIEATTGTHLLRGDSPFVLADFATNDLSVDEGFRDSLGLSLVEHLRSPGPFETVFRRTRVRGMR